LRDPCCHRTQYDSGESSQKRIAVIGKGKWIDICRRRTLDSSLNEMMNGVAMNATTTIPTSTRLTAESKLGRLFRAFCQEARRAIETVGASYRHTPPL
jgi:hypothetical protein